MKIPDRADEFNMRQITRIEATKTSRRMRLPAATCTTPSTR